MGQLCCTTIHLNSELFCWGLWHFTTVIMQNLTSCVLFSGHGESGPLPGLQYKSLFDPRGGHMHKDPVTQELSSISDSCMAKKVSTTRGDNCQGELQFISWRNLSSWLKAVLLEKKPVFQSIRWRGVKYEVERSVWLTENKKGSNAHDQQDNNQTAALYPCQLFYFGPTLFLREAAVENQEKEESFLRKEQVFFWGVLALPKVKAVAIDLESQSWEIQ